MYSLSSLSHRLTKYDNEEAHSIVRLLLERSFGLSFTDICGGALQHLSDAQKECLETMMQRLEQGEPIQYVIGHAEFLNRDFIVRPGVLIPRPETEELVSWVMASPSAPVLKGRESNILDVGTGSGCIAITLALELPQAKVTAWDISEEALLIARENAEELSAKVKFEQVDVINANFNSSTFQSFNPSTLQPFNSSTLQSFNSSTLQSFNLIISNPPYICEKEKSEMHSNVLDYEPEKALFVPDEDPLLFYRKIAETGRETLAENGYLYFEINPLYVSEMKIMLEGLGYTETEVRTDQFGKQRMIRAKMKKC